MPLKLTGSVEGLIPQAEELLWLRRDVEAVRLKGRDRYIGIGTLHVCGGLQSEPGGPIEVHTVAGARGHQFRRDRQGYAEVVKITIAGSEREIDLNTIETYGRWTKCGDGRVDHIIDKEVDEGSVICRRSGNDTGVMPADAAGRGGVKVPLTIAQGGAYDPRLVLRIIDSRRGVWRSAQGQSLDNSTACGGIIRARIVRITWDEWIIIERNVILVIGRARAIWIIEPPIDREITLQHLPAV